MSSFDTAIALEPRGDDCLTGSLDRDWWGATGPHGGYLAAILARAALSTAGPRQELRSLTIHFLGGARSGPIEVGVDRTRATRTSTAVHLTMRQGTYTDHPDHMWFPRWASAQASYHIGGGHYPVGGSQQLSDYLASCIEDAGGES